MYHYDKRYKEKKRYNDEAVDEEKPTGKTRRPYEALFFKGSYIGHRLPFFFQLHALDPQKRLNEYLLDEWDTQRGLPSVNIRGITQTADGYLWMGTRDGLIRYDGLKFETITYPEPKQPAHNLINKLITGRDGALWLSTSLGVKQYKNGVFKSYTKKEGLSGNMVVPILLDSYGRLWMGTVNNYLNRLENGNVTVFDTAAGLGASYVMGMCEDRNGRLWVAGHKDGLFYGKDGVFKKYELKEALGTNTAYSVYTVYEDRQGALWIGTNKGLLGITEPLNDERKQVWFCSTENGLGEDNVWEILEDSDNNIWVGTSGGLNRVKKTTDGGLIIHHCMPGIPVSNLFEDNEKSLWVGTHIVGLKRLRDGSIKTLSRDDGVFPHFNALYRDSKGNIWLGSCAGDIYKYEKGAFRIFIKNSDHLDLYITSIGEDKEGNLWVGTMFAGVFRMEGQTLVSVYDGGRGKGKHFVYAIFRDSRDRMWFATRRDGLWLYHNGRFQRAAGENGLLSDNILCFYEDKQDNIWIGTSAGLNRYSDLSGDGKWRRENLSAYLKGYRIMTIHGEADGTLWVGTRTAGLFRLKEGKTFQYATDSGLGSNRIIQLLEDESGNFWMAGNIGILKVSKKNLDEFADGKRKEVNCITFGVADGMLNAHCNASAFNTVIRGRRGEFWFSTINGVAIVQAENLRINKFPPPVVIEKIIFNGEGVSGKLAGETFKGIHNIRFHFTAPTFISPTKAKISYKLEGRDSDWVGLKSHNERTAFYKDLPPGEYRFMVSAVNNSGVRSQENASFHFTLGRYYYQELWFKIGLTLVILLAAVGLYFGSRRYIFLRNLKNKYKNSTLDPEKAEQTLKRIGGIMQVKKVYRDEELSLNSLAEKLKIAPRYLSQVINERLNQNFRDFVNGYRIDEAKRMLTDPGKRELSILEIAIEVGFNSKEVFNRSFKKYTGTTPTEFKKRG